MVPTKRISALSFGGGEAPNVSDRENTGRRRDDKTSIDELFPLVYSELRRLAKSHLASERPGHTLQATALVNETYLRLVGGERPQFNDRAHFIAIAARLMRQILIDHARCNQRQKRGGGAKQVDLDVLQTVAPESSKRFLFVKEALRHLSWTDKRKARVIELRFFEGLDVKGTAEALAVSENTVIRDWATAKTWLTRRFVAGRTDSARER